MTSQTSLLQALDSFLKTGRLGSITAGAASPDSVRKALGDPDETSEQRNPEIWKYGDLGVVLRSLVPDDAPGAGEPAVHGQLQLSFYRQPGESSATLTTIGILPTVSAPGFPGVIVYGNDAIGFDQFRQHLRTLGLDERSVTSGYSGSVGDDAPEAARRTSDLDSGVRATFLDERLHSLFFTARTKPAGKQLTLFVPQEVIEQARRVAASEHGATVASICTRWLTEHARGLPVADAR